MRYIILGLLLTLFTACGSGSSTETTTNHSVEEESNKPASPQPTDSSKAPPSLPSI